MGRGVSMRLGENEKGIKRRREREQKQRSG